MKPFLIAFGVTLVVMNSILYSVIHSRVQLGAAAVGLVLLVAGIAASTRKP